MSSRMFHDTLSTYSSMVSTSMPGTNSSTNPSTAMAVASHPVQLLAIHKVNMSAMMPTTFQSSALNGSFFVATWKMWSMVPWDIRSGLCTAQMDTHDTNSSTTATGAQMAAHCRNDIWIPVRDSSMPMAMMFMLLPEGNASPPMAAAYGMAIMTARPNRDSPGNRVLELQDGARDDAREQGAARQVRNEQRNACGRKHEGQDDAFGVALGDSQQGIHDLVRDLGLQQRRGQAERRQDEEQDAADEADPHGGPFVAAERQHAERRHADDQCQARYAERNRLAHPQHHARKQKPQAHLPGKGKRGGIGQECEQHDHEDGGHAAQQASAHRSMFEHGKPPLHALS